MKAELSGHFSYSFYPFSRLKTGLENDLGLYEMLKIP